MQKYFLDQTKMMSSSVRLLSNTATLTAPVTFVPTSTDPDHNLNPAFDPTFDNAMFEKVEIAGPSVPICPFGA